MYRRTKKKGTPCQHPLLLAVAACVVNCGQLERSSSIGNSLLRAVGTVLLSRITSDWGCDEPVLRKFLEEVDSLYQKQRYHNSKHASLVSGIFATICAPNLIIKTDHLHKMP